MSHNIDTYMNIIVLTSRRFFVPILASMTMQIAQNLRRQCVLGHFDLKAICPRRKIDELKRHYRGSGWP